ncbi:SDR family oxidoreductase [Exiguobacterium aestuarii]|uniref:SDR family oxidoreductase n=1 Tax=Exiguobacterium aestuarii TaxID=273527 RepID=A0ABW2PHA9_9BACL|nr:MULTISPECIES: SDR family oxidoreductase [Exiguobacterium]MCT4785121.1 SDR family oxidoreductase [Exiguobacterium aestuarii]
MGYENVKFEENALFLVTGGAGFIGSNLCEAILNKGYRVRCLDNLSTGNPKHVEMFLDNENYEFIEGDIRDLETCLDACDGVDYVLHQAAWGSVPRSIEMPLLYEEINIKGTLNMLEAARQNEVKKFVYASSSSVYGDEPTLPKVEGREGKVLSPYALTKKVNEEYARLYTQLYGLDTYGLRYFNVFGPRQNPEGNYAAVIPKFISSLINDISPIINGDGLQSRDFTYIENVIEANLKSCANSQNGKSAVYNVAYGEKHSLLDILKVMSLSLGRNVEPIFENSRLGDVKHSLACINKAKQEIQYSPDWSFQQGIEKTIDYFRGI